jgi:hypothetical protein
VRRRVVLATLQHLEQRGYSDHPISIAVDERAAGVSPCLAGELEALVGGLVCLYRALRRVVGGDGRDALGRATEV